jgi:hypothetical protein
VRNLFFSIANFLKNITDREIYSAYDITGRILYRVLKMEKAAVAVTATKGSHNLSVLYDVSLLCAADVWRDSCGRRIPGVSIARV